MIFRRRSHEDEQEQGPQNCARSGSASGGLSEMQQAGEAFLNAGDDAINRALSGDSEAFLASGRQQSGE